MSTINDKDYKSDNNKSPLSYFLGSITSILFAYMSLLISQKLIIYFSIHLVKSDSQIIQSISSGLKTLIIGSAFLSTFSFAFIGLGLFMLFIRAFFNISPQETN